MSIFFWSWRLDLVWLPVFAAGAIALVCGSRALWRFRVPLIFLFLAWPLPYVAGNIQHGLLAAAIGGFGLLVLTAVLLPRRQSPVARLTAHAAGSPGHLAGGGLIAAGLVCVAAILTTVADRHLKTATLLLDADGQPKVTAASRPATSIDGLSRIAASNTTNLPSWGSPAGRASYRYTTQQGTLPATGDPGTAGTVVDVMVPAEGRDLALSPATLATLQGYRLEASRVADLGAGLSGHLERYLAPGGKMSLLVVWWDWPVRSAAGAQRERIIVQRLVVADVPTSGSDSLLQFARHLVAATIGAATS